jgi:hypothetical protein
LVSVGGMVPGRSRFATKRSGGGVKRMAGVPARRDKGMRRCLESILGMEMDIRNDQFPSFYAIIAARRLR